MPGQGETQWMLGFSLAFPSKGPRISMAGVTCLTFHPIVILVERSFLGEKVDAKMGAHPALTHFPLILRLMEARIPHQCG